MKEQYSARWRETILASIVLHAVIFAGAFLILTVSEPEQELASSELEWIEVDRWETALPDGFGLETESIDQAEATSTSTEVYSQFGFMPLVIPEMPMPDIPDWTALEPPPPPIEHRPLPPPRPSEQTTPTQPSTPVQMPWGSAPLGSDEKSVESTEKPVEEVSTGARRMAEPPVVIEEHYPLKSGAFNFDGSVGVLVRIGEDGSVTRTQVMYSSGRMLIDGAAVSAALKWKFTPALDQDGRPMECDKILTFDFKNLM